jgi:hypothetical protein
MDHSLDLAGIGCVDQSELTAGEDRIHERTPAGSAIAVARAGWAGIRQLVFRAELRSCCADCGYGQPPHR